MDKQIVVGLDIGTTKVCTLIGTQNRDLSVDIIGVGSHVSQGLKKGSVVNIEQTVQSIRRSVEEAQLMAGVQIGEATVGIAGNHIYSFNSTGVVAVHDKEITEEDVARAIEAAKAVVIPLDRKVLHILPREFRVDNTRGIRNPVGMHGTRLEVHVHIVTGISSRIQNLVKCVELAGIQVKDVVLQPIASSRSVLSNEEKELGVAMIDIGGGTTDLAVWKDGGLVHSQILPIGGTHFTNDLAVSLKIPHPEAELIKVQHGHVIPEKLGSCTHVTVQGIPGMKSREVEVTHIAKVLGARAEELFAVVESIITEHNLSDAITGGYILTGGGALIRGLSELAEYYLEKPVKIGYPIPFGSMTSVMQDPKYATVLGLLLEAKSSELNMDANPRSMRMRKQGDIVERMGHSIRNVLKDIF